MSEPHFYEFCADILMCAKYPPIGGAGAELEAAMFSHSQPKVATEPSDQPVGPPNCVRPVIWRHGDFPGFSGTCFLASAMGHDVAVTARHVLSSAEPDNMAIPVSLEFGPMATIEPAGIFWYNTGVYDHVSDIAVALLNTHVDGAIDLANVGFTSLNVGETAITVGFPKSLSRVDYDINDEHREAFGVPEGSPFRALFLWSPAVPGSICVHAGGVAELGRVEFSEEFDSPDGMSGAPLFVMRQGKLWIGGMLVRANRNIGHFIPGLNIKPYIALNFAKSQAVVEYLLRLLANGKGDTGSAGAIIARHLAENLTSMFSGDRVQAENAFSNWPHSGKTLADIALERAEEELMQGVGGLELDMWKQRKGAWNP